MNIFYDDSGRVLSWAGKSPAPDGLHTLTVDDAGVSMRSLMDGAYYVANGELVLGAVDVDAEASKARLKRNALLAACDWTQVGDAPVDAQAWATYRAALRDLTNQPGFPTNIIWPERPA